MARAKALWKQGNIDEALTACKDAATAEPADPEAHLFLSFLYNQKIEQAKRADVFKDIGEDVLRDAISAGQHAVLLNPADADSYFYLGVNYLYVASYLDFAASPDLGDLKTVLPLDSSQFDDVIEYRHAVAEVLLREAQLHFMIAAGLQPTRSSLTILRPSPMTERNALGALEIVNSALSQRGSTSGNQPAEGEIYTPDGESTQELADTSSNMDSSATPSDSTPSHVASLGSGRQAKQGFEFLLERCAAEGEDINCWFLATNKLGKPRLSIFRDGSWLKDQGYNRHEAWRVLESNSSMEGNILELRLPNDYSERFGLHFQGLKRSVTSISYLNLHITSDDLEWRDVKVE